MKKIKLKLTTYIDAGTGIEYSIRRVGGWWKVFYHKDGRFDDVCQAGGINLRWHDPARAQRLLDDWADTTGKRFLSSRTVSLIEIEPDNFQVVDW